MGGSASAPCHSGESSLACCACSGPQVLGSGDVVVDHSAAVSEYLVGNLQDELFVDSHFDDGAGSGQEGCVSPECCGGSSSSYRSLDALTAVLDARDVALVRGSWLVQLQRSRGILPRRQELPPEASCTLGMVKSSPILAISYCWVSAKHPDPHGEQLQILGGIIDQWIKGHEGSRDIAVFIDWCSLFQEPRSVEEQASYERSLHHMNLWYAHQETSVWLLSKPPPSTQPYGERGWPTFERAISQMITPGCKVLDLGLLDGRCKDWSRTVEVCKAGQQPPTVPETFAMELQWKGFARGSDRTFVAEKYRETFDDLMGSTRELKFRSLGWGNSQVSKLAEAIPRCSRLQVLDLRENHIGDEGAEKLAAVIWHCSDLRKLDVSGNEIGDNGASLLCQAIPKSSRLQILDLAQNGIGDRGARFVAEALPCCDRLQSLLLSRNEIGDVGARLIASALPHCAGLQVLDFSENEIGDSGVKQLAAEISRCGCLQKLNLARNRIGDGGAKELAAAIPQCRQLEELGVGGNEIGEILGGSRIGDGGAETLATAMVHCDRLQKLDLSENQIGDGGTERLAAALPHCDHLTDLNLCGNRIADGGAGKLAEAVVRCSRLTQLRLLGNLLSGPGERHLREAWRSAGKPEERLHCCNR